MISEVWTQSYWNDIMAWRSKDVVIQYDHAEGEELELRKILELFVTLS